MRPAITLTLWLFACFNLWAYQSGSKADSLRTQLRHAQADSNRVKLLLDLGYFHVLKPGEQATDLDTALLLVKQAYNLSITLQYTRGQGRAHLIAAQAYREGGQRQFGKQYAEKALKLFQTHNMTAELADACIEVGHFYDPYSETELVDKIRYFERGLRLYQQLGKKERQATILKDLADFHQLQSNYRQALGELQQALALYQEIKYPYLQGVYDLLGNVSTLLGEYKQAVQYGLLAAETARMVGDTSLQLCTIHNRLGVTYFELGQYERAETHFRKSMSVAEKYKDTISIRVLAPNIAKVLLSLNRPRQALTFLTDVEKRYASPYIEDQVKLAGFIVDTYVMLKRYNQAQPYVNRLLLLSKKLKKTDNLNLNLYKAVIPYFLSTRQYNHALELLPHHQQICRKEGFKLGLVNNYLWWFKADSAQGNHASAVSNLQQYIRIKDALFNENTSKQIAQLDIAYETKQKNQTLKIKEQNIQILTQKSKLQQSQLQQARTTRNGVTAGAVMLVLLLGISYNRYSIKKRSNQQLQAKQLLIDQKNQSLQQLLSEKEGLLMEREWMLKEIHHRVKNNLQVISSMLNSQAYFMQDTDALAALRESQNRVHVMALLHQKLYQTDHLEGIMMDEYISEIVQHLLESFHRQLTVDTHVTITPVRLDVTLAIPLGLIINEAITNSLKYAFPDQAKGTIQVSLIKCAEATYELTIADNGVGLPADFDATHRKSLGLTMIHGLSNQIGANLQMEGRSGVCISIVFNEELLAENRFVQENLTPYE